MQDKRKRRNQLTFTLQFNEDEDLARLKRLVALEQRSVSELITVEVMKYINKHYRPEYDTYFLRPGNDDEEKNSETKYESRSNGRSYTNEE